jgi:hypothetical protein
MAGYTFLKKPYTPVVLISAAGNFNVYGKSFFRVTNVYLSGYPYENQTFYNPFSSIPKLSANYPGFFGVKLLSSQYTSNNENTVTFTMPSATRPGYTDIIVENPAGYGKLTQYVVKYLYSGEQTQLQLRPWSDGIEVRLFPTFLRDFATYKTLNHGEGPDISFTRASIATFFDANGVLQTAGNNVPRFDHDPTTGESRGLLIEEARVNLHTNSNNLSTLTTTGASVVSDVEIAPDGTNTADFLKEDSSNNQHRVRAAYSFVTQNLTYSLSIFAKAGTRNWLRLELQPGATFGAPRFAFFDLTNGVIGTVEGSTQARITSVNNGWYRCSITATASNSLPADSRFAIAPSDNVVSFLGDGTSGLYLWGAQFEQGPFSTSYIPTTTTTVPREADSAIVNPISSFYNQAEGTLFAEGSFANANSSVNAGNRIFAQFDEGNASANYVSLYTRGGNGQGVGEIRVSGTTQFDGTIGTATNSIGVITRWGMAFKTNDAIAAKDGTLGSADTSVTLPAATHLRLSLATFNSVHLRKIAYYPQRLSNYLLQQLTL